MFFVRIRLGTLLYVHIVGIRELSSNPGEVGHALRRSSSYAISSNTVGLLNNTVAIFVHSVIS